MMSNCLAATGIVSATMSCSVILYLDQLRVVIVAVIHSRAMRIGLLRHPVQLVVSVGDGLVPAVCLAGLTIVVAAAAKYFRGRPIHAQHECGL